MESKKRKIGSQYEPGEIRFEQGTGKITYMCSAGDKMIIFKVDKTFEVITPEISDPAETNPNMPFSAKVVSDFGSGNEVNTRVFIQPHAAYNQFLQQDSRFPSIVKALYDSRAHLLSALAVKQQIENDVLAQLSVVPRKVSNAYVNLPVVADLERNVSVFLMNTKMSIQCIVSVFNIFFDTSINGPHFHKVREYLSNTSRGDSLLHKLVSDTEPDISYIVNMRNAQEHPSESLWLCISNFTLLPDESLSRPTIQNNEQGPFDLVEEINKVLNFLIDTFEIFTLHCLIEYLKPKYEAYISEIPDKFIRPDCAYRYNVLIRMPS